MTVRPDTASAFFWSLFSAGAFVVALLLPVHIVLFHFGPDLGLLEEGMLEREALAAWLDGGVLVRIYLFLLIGGALFHGAHRLKYVLFDWGMTHAYRGVGTGLYAVAIGGTFLAFVVTLWPLIWGIVRAILPI